MIELRSLSSLESEETFSKWTYRVVGHSVKHSIAWVDRATAEAKMAEHAKHWPDTEYELIELQTSVRVVTP